MATISTAIRVTDGMTPAFRSMNKAMNIVLSSFEAIQGASANAVDVASIRAVRQELNNAEIIMNDTVASIEKADRQQQKFNNRLSNGHRMMNKIKGAAAAVGITLGARKVLETSDELTLTRSRLNLINDGQRTTLELQQMIFDSSQRTRSSYTATSETVSKLGILAKDAFSNNAEMVLFAEQMSKQFKIGGASIQEQTAAMYQLTQAMAAGRLQGDEFRSIMENAPLLAQSIAQHMGKSVGELREMSSEGLITADVIKNAMFASAEETNAKFADLPMTFDQVGVYMKNSFLKTFEPMIMTVGKGAKFTYDNWSTIEPIMWGLAAATGIYATALGYQAVTTWLAVEANKAMIASMLANPALWVAIAIGALIAIIYKWVNAVGGVGIAHEIVKDQILRGIDNIGIWVARSEDLMLSSWDRIVIGGKYAFLGLTNFFGVVFSGIYMGMQNTANGVIDIVNWLSQKLNGIAGTSFGTIERMSFGTQWAMNEEAARQSRLAELNAFVAEKEAMGLDRQRRIEGLVQGASVRQAERQMAIKASQESALGSNSDPLMSLVSGIAGDVSGISDSVSMSEEDLKYMRDIAEQEAINRFTTAEIKVDMKTEIAGVNNEMDLDGIVEHLETKVHEAMTVAAEGEDSDV
jgi:tape measure domain-containing protein